MKILATLVLTLLSTASTAEDFGDLIPSPVMGNKWNLSIASDGSQENFELEIIAIDDSSYTKGLTSENYNSIVKTNYFVRDGICFQSSSDNFDINNILINSLVFKPPIRCHIKREEMPFREVYKAEYLNSDSKLTRTEVRDRTHRFSGLDIVKTPSGKYTAEKIIIVGIKVKLTVWRDKNNALIKQRVKYSDDDYESMTVLLNGKSH